MNLSENCPFCESSNLTLVTKTEKLKTRGAPVRAKFNYTKCSACKSIFATFEQMKENDDIAIMARRSSSVVKLSPKKIRDIRLGLGLNQAQAGEFFGGGPVAFSKYESGTVVPSQAMQALLVTTGACPNQLALIKIFVSEGVDSTNDALRLNSWTILKTRGAGVGSVIVPDVFRAASNALSYATTSNGTTGGGFAPPPRANTPSNSIRLQGVIHAERN